jgi:hypothetical protein
VADRAVRERLAHDISLWLADGLVSRHTHDLLRQRYDAQEFGIANAIKSLGIAGGLIAFFGLLGLVATLAGSQAFAAFLLFAVGVGLTLFGVRLSTDQLGRYSISSKAVLMLGVVTTVLGIGIALDAMGIKSQQGIFVTGILVLVPIGIIAYRFRITFLLVMGLIAFFHWVGSWTSMFGRSGYELDIQDPRLMSVAALAAVLVGIYHERCLRAETGRFFQAFESMGLIYLNLSLLIMTIESRWGSVALWIILWAAVALSQIVAGARLHNSLLTGFGVTAFAINVYTRYYETFWNRLHVGVFFLLGGFALFIVSVVCEVTLRRWQGSTA